MTRRTAAAVVFCAGAVTVAAQSVYPTGTTIYDPTRAWSGYTVLSPLNTQAVIVIDMNGNVVKRWEGFVNSAGGPARVFPGGVVMAANGANPPHQESLELVERDFDGTCAVAVRPQSADPDARRPHDLVGAPAPRLAAGRLPGRLLLAGSHTRDPTAGKTLVLTHINHSHPNVADTSLEDDRLIEVSPTGEILWEWVASDHVEELGFSVAARRAIKADAGPARNGAARTPQPRDGTASTGCTSTRRPTSGRTGGSMPAIDDSRPDNVIISSRQASLSPSSARDGKIVWRLGPDFSESKELRAIRQIIGQHHRAPHPEGPARRGQSAGVRQRRRERVRLRDSGRARRREVVRARRLARARNQPRDARAGLVVQRTALLQHQHQQRAAAAERQHAHRREGASGRVFEVTNDGAIVWEYMYPVFGGAQCVERRLPRPIASRTTGFRR